MKKIIFFLFIISAAIINAQDAETIYKEAQTLREQKKYAEAIEKYKMAYNMNSTKTEALYEAGWCLNETKKYSEAITALKTVRKSWNDKAKVHFELGYAFEKDSQYDSALACYDKCYNINKTYKGLEKRMGFVWYNKNDDAKAIEHFKKEIINYPDVNDYMLWYRKGYCENAVKSYNDAIASLKKAQEFKADNENTYLELGFAYSRLKDDDNAITNYKKAIELNPQSHIGYNGIGEVYRDNKKEYPTAMEWYNKALSVKPNERKANFGIAYCLNSQQKYADAIPYLKKAIEAEPDYTAAYVELGYSYYATNDDALAETNFKKALSINNSNQNARYYLGLMYIRKGDKTKAQQMANELKDLGSKNAATLQTKIDNM